MRSDTIVLTSDSILISSTYPECTPPLYPIAYVHATGLRGSIPLYVFDNLHEHLLLSAFRSLPCHDTRKVQVQHSSQGATAWYSGVAFAARRGCEGKRRRPGGRRAPGGRGSVSNNVPTRNRGAPPLTPRDNRLLTPAHPGVRSMPALSRWRIFDEQWRG